MAVVMMKNNGAWYPLPDEREVEVRARWKVGHKQIDLYGDGKTAVVAGSGIDQIVSDEQFEMLERQKQGDWRCRDGVWHTKADRYCGGHKPAEPPLDLSYLREGRERGPVTETGKRWLELMRLNNLQLKHHGKYGTLRTLEQLDQFEKDGIWPEPQPRSFNTRTVMRRVPDVSPFPDPNRKPKYEMVEVPND